MHLQIGDSAWLSWQGCHRQAPVRTPSNFKSDFEFSCLFFLSFGGQLAFRQSVVRIPVASTTFTSPPGLINHFYTQDTILQTTAKVPNLHNEHDG